MPASAVVIGYTKKWGE